MTKRFDLPGIIPVFPLPGALLLPRARLPLHLFEPRYLTMLEDALKTPERLIGMVQPYAVRAARGARAACDRLCGPRHAVLRDRGRALHDHAHRALAVPGPRGGRGIRPYRRAKVSWDGFDRDKGPTETDEGFDRERFMNLLSRYFTSRELETDWESLSQADDEL